MTDSFLSVDIGTSSVKAALFSFEGDCLRFARVPVNGGADGTLCAGEWLTALRCLVQNFGGVQPAGITVCGNGPTLVPVGDEGEPVHNVLVWRDGRARSLPGERSLFLPKAAWLMREEPAVYEKTRSFLGCPEYLVFYLTGEKCAFSPSPEFSPYVWTQDSLAAYGFEPAKFPPVVFTAREAGKTGRRAEDFGIPRGVPVYAGGPDFLMTLLGTACVRPGRVCDRAGTSEGINVCAATPVVSDRLRCLPHVIPGLWNAGALLPPTGQVLEWFRRVSGQARLPWDEILRSLRPSGGEDWPGPGCAACPPDLAALAGDYAEFTAWILARRGAGLSWNDIGLCIVEAIGQALRRAIAEIEAAGFPVDVLRVSGGQARSAEWNRRKAAMTGKTLRVARLEDAELLGCLAAGLYGRGVYSGLREASENLARFGADYAPDGCKN